MLREEGKLERVVYVWCFIGVLAGVAIGTGELAREEGVEGLTELGKLALMSILVLGKFVIFLGLAEDNSLTPWSLAIMVWLIDLVIGFLLMSGLEGLERTPLLGGWLKRARTRAVEVFEKYPGLERMAFFGVVAFVMLPLAATGAVSGSFAARMVGLSRLAGVLAIAVGSLGTAVIFALLATFFGERAEDFAHSPILIGGTLLGLILAGRYAFKRITTKFGRSQP